MTARNRKIIPVLVLYLLTGGAALAAETKEAKPASPAKKLLSKWVNPAPAAKAKTPVPGPKKPDVKTMEKKVTGTVMFIRKNKISVEFEATEEGGEDMYLPLDKEVKVQRVKDFSEIKQGDRVEVKYKQTYLEPKEKGGEPVILDTKGTLITVLKSAPPAVKAPERGLVA